MSTSRIPNCSRDSSKYSRAMRRKPRRWARGLHAASHAAHGLVELQRASWQQGSCLCCRRMARALRRP
eukprot:360913-Chlamydomonas_euryale.AAC.5